MYLSLIYQLIDQFEMPEDFLALLSTRPLELPLEAIDLTLFLEPLL
jgi:hypothetical protein